MFVLSTYIDEAGSDGWLYLDSKYKRKHNNQLKLNNEYYGFVTMMTYK